jgi:poly(3-hydroxybutyrate) depolymerase
MRHLTTAFALVCALQPVAATSGVHGRPDVPGMDRTVEASLAHGGRDRTYRLHLPVTPRSPAPLVIALHGGTGRGLGTEIISNLTPLSDREGFIVVGRTTRQIDAAEEMWAFFEAHTR